MRFPGFTGGTSYGRHFTAGSERSVNWFPHALGSPGPKAQYVMHAVPGVQRDAFAPNEGLGGPVREMFDVAGARLFAVIGRNLVEIHSDGSYTKVIEMRSNERRAYAASTGRAGEELLVVSHDKGYLVDLTGAQAAVKVVDDVHQCAMLNGHFLGLDRENSILRGSNVLDGRTWNAANIAARNVAGDPWTAMRVTPVGYLWLFGELTTEVWWNTGVGNFPFAPVRGAFLNSGTPAPDSPAIVGNSVYWLHQNREGQRLVMEGTPSYQLREVSTPEIASQLQDLDKVDDAFGWAYQQDGHQFYVLAFASAGATWVYDVTTGVWHERGAWQTTPVEPGGRIYQRGAAAFMSVVPLVGPVVDVAFAPAGRMALRGAVDITSLERFRLGRSRLGSTAVLGRGVPSTSFKPTGRIEMYGNGRVSAFQYTAWRPRLYAHAFGRNLVGDADGAGIYVLDPKSGIDIGGYNMRRVRQLPHIGTERRRLFVDMLEIDFNRGIPGTSEHPFIMRLQVSWDGGRTWGEEMPREAPHGDYRARLRWFRIGSGYDPVFRLVCDDTEPVHLTAAIIEVTAGTH